MKPPRLLSPVGIALLLVASAIPGCGGDSNPQDGDATNDAPEEDAPGEVRTTPEDPRRPARTPWTGRTSRKPPTKGSRRRSWTAATTRTPATRPRAS